MSLSAPTAPQVVQVFQNLERILDDGMGLLALDMRHKTHATGVVLTGVGIQTVFGQMLDLGCRAHGAL